MTRKGAAWALALAAMLPACRRAERDPYVPAGASKEEEARMRGASAFVASLPMDPLLMDHEMELAFAGSRPAEEKIRMLISILSLQPPPDAGAEEVQRLTACWSSARRILVAQGVSAIRPVVQEMRRNGVGFAGADQVLVELGASATRVLEEVLASPYPRRKDPGYPAEVQARSLFVYCLGKIASAGSVPALERIFLSDPEPAVRFAARQAIVQMRDQRFVNAITGYLRSPNEYWSSFSRHLLTEIYGHPGYFKENGRDPAKWLAAFDNSYRKMRPPAGKLLECLDVESDPEGGKVSVREFAHIVLAKATGKDLGSDRQAWADLFKREDAATVRLLVRGLSDAVDINRDAVREDLVRLTKGVDFGTSPESWTRGLTEIGFFKE